jgi:hypothetical protein
LAVASRRGVRLTPNCSAITRSSIRDPGANRPEAIISRIAW